MTMLGRMMDLPLTVSLLLERARTFFPRGEVVTREPDGSITRATYGDVVGRCARLAAALKRMGVKPGDRVATLAWNHQRHLELYLAVPASGAVLHTLNLRLHPGELAFIARAAEDKVLFVDRSLLPLYKQFAADVPSITKVIVIDDEYESLLTDDEYEWPALDEGAAAAICFTSGTTGDPKGVVYSHRSTVLHTLTVCLADCLAVTERDAILPVVPMFHANAWGLPYAAVLTGAKLVFPGPRLDASSLLELLTAEKITLAAGVPTIWLGILAALDAEPGRRDLSAIRTMIIGGSAAPPSMIDGFQRRHGLHVTHAWGMTEMSPLGSVARAKRHLEDTVELRAAQGYAVPLVEQRHVDADGKTLPWDGATMGELHVRGPFVAASYLNDAGPDRFTADGWFKTGDVVTIDPEGYLRITDREKDVIKSGGEWISSVALENALMSHPSVLEAAVFAAQSEKWSERPLAAIVLKPGASATGDELRAHICERFAKFWLPDDYLFLEAIPRTSTGKFLKSKLREQYGRHLVDV
jgi:fatty-acyl-CoA synthase